MILLNPHTLIKFHQKMKSFKTNYSNSVRWLPYGRSEKQLVPEDSGKGGFQIVKNRSKLRY